MRKFDTKEIELYMHYGSAGSEAMGDYPCHIFQLPNKTGIIAYRIEHNCAIVFGDPICPNDALTELTLAFHKHCKDAELNIIYITVSERFANLAQEHCHISLEACEELIFNPQVNPLLKSHRLQHRVEKAIKHGLTFHEYIPFNIEIEKALLQVGVEWQKAKKGPRFHLGHLNFFENRMGKRWFYVKDGDLITSIAMLSQLKGKEGWLLKFFFTLPNAFHETSEFLMISLLSKLKEENCRFLTKGMTPIDSIVKTKGLGYYSILVKCAYSTLSFFFNFKKNKQYWQRYHPEKVPAFLLFNNPNIGLNEIKALLKVLRH